MATLIIMDYGSGCVYAKVGDYTNWDSEKFEDYISEDLGFNLGNVYYMVTSEEYPIEYLD